MSEKLSKFVHYLPGGNCRLHYALHKKPEISQLDGQFSCDNLDDQNLRALRKAAVKAQIYRDHLVKIAMLINSRKDLASTPKDPLESHQVGPLRSTASGAYETEIVAAWKGLKSKMWEFHRQLYNTLDYIDGRVYNRLYGFEDDSQMMDDEDDQLVYAEGRREIEAVVSLAQVAGRTVHRSPTPSNARPSIVYDSQLKRKMSLIYVDPVEEWFCCDYANKDLPFLKEAITQAQQYSTHISKLALLINSRGGLIYEPTRFPDLLSELKSTSEMHLEGTLGLTPSEICKKETYATWSELEGKMWGLHDGLQFLTRNMDEMAIIRSSGYKSLDDFAKRVINKGNNNDEDDDDDDDMMDADDETELEPNITFEEYLNMFDEKDRKDLDGKDSEAGDDEQGN
ncbi:MAG: hypothetical protein Q9220_005752 [cf. Caloplaca sp. 1 TL-2023]